MDVVIQCASRKQDAAPGLRAPDGREVRFVADPSAADSVDGVLWARPDDPAPGLGRTWRQELDRLVASGEASRSLLPAWQLYTPRPYKRLVEAFGVDHVFVLSAGWGLVRASQPLPSYDITFSATGGAARRRRKGERYGDYMQLPRAGPGPVVFLGGKDYLPLFEALVETTPRRKIVLTRVALGAGSAEVQREGLWSYVPFATAACTNWHYAAAEALCRNSADVLSEVPR